MGMRLEELGGKKRRGDDLKFLHLKMDYTYYCTIYKIKLNHCSQDTREVSRLSKV